MGAQKRARRNAKADYARAKGRYFGSTSEVGDGMKRAAQRLKAEAKARDKRLAKAEAPTRETRQQARAAVRRMFKPAPETIQKKRWRKKK